MNPDCRDGKHAACRGDAWDDDTDTETTCNTPSTPHGDAP